MSTTRERVTPPFGTTPCGEQWQAYYEQKRSDVLAALRAGSTRGNAARYARIAPQTLSNWITRDPDFELEVNKAEADCELRMVTTLRVAADNGDWRAALEWLRRRRPQEWGASDRLTHKFEGMTEDELNRYLAECYRNAGVAPTLEVLEPDGENSRGPLALPPPTDGDEWDDSP